MRDEARAQLDGVVFPFWLDRGIDHSSGGFFTCFDNRGQELRSTDKFTWSQGRFVWVLSRAAQLARDGLLSLDHDQLITWAERGARFLVDHAVQEDGRCHFVLERDGTPTEGPSGETQSVYADCFVVMGLAELARTTGDRAWLDAAQPVLATAAGSIVAGTGPTPPYPVPEGFTAFGPRMILLNTLLDVVRAKRDLGVADAHDLSSLEAARTAMLRHRRPDGTFLEMIPDEPDERSLVARHRVPGHALEGVWVALEASEILGDAEAHGETLSRSVDALASAAWDPEHGGLLRYTDSAGPVEPHGDEAGTGYESLVRQTWSTKLWWVHSEAAYTTSLVARRFGDPSAVGWAERIWTYMLSTFPASDEGAEWIQIRDRKGGPLDQVVALPVKDPFHVTRNLMQMVALQAG